MSIPLSALAQEEKAEEPSEKGGFLGGLKKMIPKSAEGLTDKVGSAVNSAVEAGKESANQLIDSVTDADSKKNEILAYLEEKLAGRSSSITDAQVQAYTKEIIPLIESINERKFTRPPRVVIAGHLQVIQALAQDLVPQFEKMQPGISKPLVYLQAYLSAALWSPDLLGKYSYSTQTVYLLPANLDAIMKAKGIDPAYLNDILKIVIGHELTHDLQDQQADLKRLILTAQSSDGLSAINATLEGHSMFSENLLSKQIGLTEASQELSKLMHAEDLEEDAWLFERISHVAAVQHEQIYNGGTKFVAYHHGKGGMPAIWNLLKNPPQRSSMISQPHTYTATPPPLPDYELKFMPLKARLGDSVQWAFNAGTTGDFQLRGILSGLDHDTRERIMQNLVEMVYVNLPHKTSLARNIDIALFKFKNDEEARIMATALEKLALQRHKDMDRNSRLRVRGMAQQPYVLAGIPAGIEWRYQVEALLLGKTSHTEVIATRGTSVATLFETDSGLSRPQLEALLAEAFTLFGTKSPAPPAAGITPSSKL